MNDKAVELSKKLQELSNQIVTDPDKLEQFSKQWNNGFHGYSMGNTILIWSQKKDASLCAGYHDWLGKHKRYVKRGEKAISILAPMFFKAHKQVKNDAGEVEEVEVPVTHFRVVSVFDVSQTDGEPLELGHSDKITGECQLTIDQVSKLFEYPVIYSNGLSNGSTDGKAITISERGNSRAMLATYFHELAHAQLHFGNNRKELSSDIKELEAEAVSYLVCSSIGLENDKAKYYIGNWRGNAEKLGNSGSKILKTAEKIVRAIEKNPVKE